jgi:hypothetical protein
MTMASEDIEALARLEGFSETAIATDVLRQFPNDDSISFRDWAKAIKPSKPHWIEAKPAVAGDELYSIDAQSAYLKANGEAATIVHLARHGLKLGNVSRQSAAEKSAQPDVKAKSVSTDNPWGDKWRGTPQEAEAEKDRLIKKFGTAGAQRLYDLGG